MRRWKILYIALFFAACLVPSAGMLFGGAEQSSENRRLSEAPALRGEDGWNRDYLEEAGTYFEEHFGFRNELVTGNALLVSGLFGVSADDGVIDGKDGWLYYMDSLEDYQGAGLMTERQLFDAAHTLAMVQQYAQGQGVDFLFAVAPNKNSLYGENMPYYYRGWRSEENNLSRIRGCLEAEGVHYLDLSDALQTSGEVLYHRGDSHWNNRGAAIAADAVFGALDKKHVSRADQAYEVRRDFEGDLDKMLYPALKKKEEEIYYDPQPEFSYVERVESNFDPSIHTVSGKGQGSLVMYRDSFGNALLPYMAEAYGKAYFSRGVPWYLSDLSDCGADTLIVEKAERFLPDLIRDAPVMAAPIVPAGQLEEAVYTTEIPDLKTEQQGALTRISGAVPEGMCRTQSRIYIRLNGLVNFEAFPVSSDEGREGFSLCIPASLLEGKTPVFEMYVSAQ